VAVHHVIAYLETSISDSAYRVAGIAIWALTLGFMLIAGAFGLWAIQFSAESEGRRRIGQLVETIDYMSDGLVAIDRRGRITAMNPTARRIAGVKELKRGPIRNCFPALSDADIDSVLSTPEPMELERKGTGQDGPILRFRSQPSEGMVLLLISDITNRTNQETRNRSVARLQLIGHLVRGVAHDFNTLLCGLAGHALLLERLPAGSPDYMRSLKAIRQSTDRGISLAGHILQLAMPEGHGFAHGTIREAVENAKSALKLSLSSDWRIDIEIADGLPLIPFTNMQMEQLILNLSLLLADMSEKAGILRIIAGRPGSSPLLPASDSYSVVLLFVADSSEVHGSPSDYREGTSRDSGILVSVITSIIEETGGRIDSLRRLDGSPAFRVMLHSAPSSTTIGVSSDSPFPEEFKAYVANWRVLMAATPPTLSLLESMFTGVPILMEKVDDLVSALARIEKGDDLTVMVIEKSFLGEEAPALLRASLKLSPGIGIVAISNDPQSEPPDMATEMVFLKSPPQVVALVSAMMDARSMSLRRHPA